LAGLADFRSRWPSPSNGGALACFFIAFHFSLIHIILDGVFSKSDFGTEAFIVQHFLYD
jgi:hypothetical protein